MRADLLHVITPSFNIRRFKSHGHNLRRFAHEMLEAGVQLHIVECAFGDIPFEFDDIAGVDHIGLTASGPVWNKERLINIGIARLPRDWKYVAWVDGDLSFLRKNWASETIYALQHYSFVQPWEHCYDLGPDGEHVDLHHSFCRQWIKEEITIDKMGKGYRFAHPGYAWATTRSVYEAVGGLIDMAALGAADHHMALAMLEKAPLSLPGNISPGYRAMVMDWQNRAKGVVDSNIGYIAGTISHHFHGSKADRAYVSRWEILTRHNFDPKTDLKVNTAGLYELTGKPRLRKDMMAYFANRNEDTTVL